MIINDIHLENFVSHKKTDLELGYGINVVIGPNGAGKTAILDAISFALFCDYSNRGKKDNLINAKEKESNVELGFSENGIKYSVNWLIRRKGSSKGRLYREQDGKKILQAERGSKAVVEEIEKILSIDKSMFLQSVYVRQGEIEKLVTARPAERKELISKLLNIQDLEKAYDKIKPVIDSYKEIQTILKTELNQKKELEKERKGYLQTSKKLRQKLKQERVKLAAIEIAIGKLKIEFKNLKITKRKFDKLDTNKQVLETQIQSAQEKFEKTKIELKNSEEAGKIVKKLQKEVKKIEILEKYSQTLNKKTKIEIKLETLKLELNTLIDLEKTLEKFEDIHNQYNQKIKEREQTIQDRKEHEGAPQAIKKTLKHIEEIKKDKENHKKALEKILSKSSEILKEEITIKNLDSILETTKSETQKNIDQLDLDIDKIKSNITLLKNRKKELKENLTKLNMDDSKQQNCPTCETELPQDRINYLIEKFSVEKDQLPKQIHKIKQELDDLKIKKKLFEKLNKRMNKIDPLRVEELVQDIKKTKERIKTYQQEIINLKKQEVKLKKSDKKLLQIEEEISQLKKPNLIFETAKNQKEKSRSQKQIKTDIEPLEKEIKTENLTLDKTVLKLGYKPENTEKELTDLRNKKQQFDQNSPIAKLKPKLNAEIKTIEKNLNNYKAKKEKIDQNIQDLNFNEEDLIKQEKIIEENKTKQANLEKVIATEESEKKTAETEAENREKKLEKLEKKAKEKQILEGFIRILRNIRSAYGKDGIQKIIRARARPLLEHSARDFFERFNLAYSDIKLDDDYNISVIGPSGVQEIDQISGGERVALAIALRLAIAQVLSGRIETIIMDEPTTHLDEVRRKELVNILNSFFREGGRIIPQMIIISHHREIEDVADVIYSVKKQDDYSIVQTGSIM